MTKFFILRHGETEWNHEHNRYCGRSDIPLSPTGIEQALLVSEALRDVAFDLIITSPLQRAKNTATLIKDHLNLQKETITDGRLLEIDFGKWEGLTRKEIEKNYSDGWTKWLRDPTNINAGEIGETANEVYNRTLSFYKETINKYPNATILIVAHNTVNRLFITGTLGLPFNNYRQFIQSNTGISILDWNSKNEIRWQQLNSMMHLL